MDIFNIQGQESAGHFQVPFSLPLPGSKAFTPITHDLDLNLVEGDYEVRLSYLDFQVAAEPLTVRGGMKKEKTIGPYPRVVLMNLNPPRLFNPKNNPADAPLVYLSGLLRARQIPCETGLNILDSYLRLHKGYGNVTVVAGNFIGRNLRSTLRERVWSGEGLILLLDSGFNQLHWSPFTGVEVRSVPLKDREDSVHILPTPLGAEGQLALPEKNRWVIRPLADDVMVVAETTGKKLPVMVYRPHGKGFVLVIAMPLHVLAGQDKLSRLLLDVIARCNRAPNPALELTRLLPIQLALENQGPTARQVTFQELLPPDVQGFDFNPEPLPGDELKWKLTLAPATKTSLNYWLKLPDKIDTYPIKTEFLDNDTPLGEVTLSLDVSQTVHAGLMELVVELETLATTGRDAQRIARVIRHLLSIRNRGGADILSAIHDLHDALAAADQLEQVSTTDIEMQRLKLADFIRVLGRRLHEKVAPLGLPGLTPFITLITAE